MIPSGRPDGRQMPGMGSCQPGAGLPKDSLKRRFFVRRRDDHAFATIRSAIVGPSGFGIGDILGDGIHFFPLKSHPGRRYIN